MPKPRRLAITALLAAAASLTLLACRSSSAQDDPELERPDMSVRAPEFPQGFAWLNTNKPLRFSSELKGQVVVLDFWTYCCINCMHVLPDLEYLEHKYKDQPVVIIGVHSNKFDNEGTLPTVRAAVQRDNVTHPVVVDENHRIWDSFAINSWPTVVVIGADGKLVGQISGEGHRALLDKAIQRALADAKTNNTLAAAPLNLPKEATVRAASGLSFPAKVLADQPNNRLVIVDSNHNRLLLTTWPTPDGHVTVTKTIGAGTIGHDDGSLATATFHRPQGAAFAGPNTLYVADTENHLIRRVDLDKDRVTTFLGTGKQTFEPEAGKSGTQQPLNSPWDVAVGKNRLYVANAGQHQIFVTNLMTGMTEVAAGSARENIRDGDAANANLAQTSGLALDTPNNRLYFADSETSSLRYLDFNDNTVHTLVGHGLFDFGDIDGDYETARLQHDLGVSLLHNGTQLLVADTYNHKVKRFDLASGKLSSLAGTGKPGTSSGTALALFEPASITPASPDSDLAFIADTNNHRIVQLNVATGAWQELTIDGLSQPQLADNTENKNAISAGSPALPTAAPLTLTIALKIPTGDHLTPGAPISLKISDSTKTLLTTSIPATDDNSLTTTLTPALLAAHPTELFITAFYSHCTTGNSPVCIPEQVTWKLTPTYSDTGNAKLAIGV